MAINNYQSDTQPTIDPSQGYNPSTGYTFTPSWTPTSATNRGQPTTVPSGTFTGAPQTYNPTTGQYTTINPTTNQPVVTATVNPTTGQLNQPGANPTPTTPTTTPTTGGGTFTNQSAQDYFNQLFPGDTLSPEMLDANKANLAAHGITVHYNAENQATKIILPDGTYIDPIIDAGGQNKKSWQIISGPNGAPLAGSLGYATGSGSYLAPWTQTWNAPTAEQALNSPGVQFALNNALNVMENSAAARGVLGNARAQEAISQDLGQQLLGNYQQIYNQALQTYQQQQADFFANQDRPFSKNLQLMNLGSNTAQAG